MWKGEKHAKLQQGELPGSRVEVKARRAVGALLEGIHHKLTATTIRTIRDRRTRRDWRGGGFRHVGLRRAWLHDIRQVDGGLFGPRCCHHRRELFLRFRWGCSLGGGCGVSIRGHRHRGRDLIRWSVRRRVKLRGRNGIRDLSAGGRHRTSGRGGGGHSRMVRGASRGSRRVVRGTSRGRTRPLNCWLGRRFGWGGGQWGRRSGIASWFQREGIRLKVVHTWHPEW